MTAQCIPIVLADSEVVLVVEAELDHVVVELESQLVVLRVIKELGRDLLRDDLGANVVLGNTITQNILHGKVRYEKIR